MNPATRWIDHYLRGAAFFVGCSLGSCVWAEGAGLPDPSILPYLVECAIPEGDTITLSVDGEATEYSGGFGLAPLWRSRPLTLVEQQWLTACLLARTNLLGRKVQISMRAEESPSPLLVPGFDERSEFPVFEGGFFGNVFAEKPTAFVCGPQRDLAEAARLGDRLCTLKGDKGPATLCGFTHVGTCPEPSDLPIIYVFLRELDTQ